MSASYFTDVLLMSIICYCFLFFFSRKRTLLIVREMRRCVDNSFYNLDPNDRIDVVMRVKVRM